MKTFLPIAQIIVSALLILFVLLQQRGTALGGAFGESGGFYATRRGIEKKIFWATIIAGILFVALAVAHLVL